MLEGCQPVAPLLHPTLMQLRLGWPGRGMSHSKAPWCRRSEAPCISSPASRGKAYPGVLPALDKINSGCVSAVGLMKTYHQAWEG